MFFQENVKREDLRTTYPSMFALPKMKLKCYCLWSCTCFVEDKPNILYRNALSSNMSYKGFHPNCFLYVNATNVVLNVLCILIFLYIHRSYNVC